MRYYHLRTRCQLFCSPSKLSSCREASCSTDSITTIRFTTLQRETMTFESDPDMCINRPNFSPCEGRKVEIVYDSSNPHQAIVKGSASPLGSVIFCIGVGIYLSIFGVIIITVQLSEFRAR